MCKTTITIIIVFFSRIGYTACVIAASPFPLLPCLLALFSCTRMTFDSNSNGVDAMSSTDIQPANVDQSQGHIYKGQDIGQVNSIIEGETT